MLAAVGLRLRLILQMGEMGWSIGLCGAIGGLQAGLSGFEWGIMRGNAGKGLQWPRSLVSLADYDGGGLIGVNGYFWVYLNLCLDCSIVARMFVL